MAKEDQELQRPPDRDWLSFYEAAKQIELELCVSPGKAHSILRELCATGEVRSIKEPYTMAGDKPQTQARIEPSEWRDREIDLMADDDGCQYLVDVSDLDLRYWLHASRFTQERGKQFRILALLTELFPTGHVPDPAFCPRQSLKVELQKLDPSLEPLDEATLEATIEKYNARPKDP